MDARVLALVTFVISGALLVLSVVFRGTPSGDLPFKDLPMVFSASLIALAITELRKPEAK